MNKITIVTICFNDVEGLIKSCASVDMQITKPYQHIIINGSTTKDVEEWYNKTTQSCFRSIINERDRGISDAFNKGIQLVDDGVVHLLNSGDVYSSDQVLTLVHSTFQNHPAIQWISGKITLKRAGMWVNIGKPFDRNQLYKGMRSVSHPTWFVRKEVYNRVGLFNEHYKIAMDYDLMCRIKDEPYLFLDQVIARFDDTGVSSVQYLKSLKQNIEVYESHFGFSLLCRLWQFRQKLFYYFLETLIGKFIFKIKSKYF
jgi:glycosyltransferase involved in cell wall biosynthesis